MKDQIKIALIDDEELILEGLALLFSGQKQVSVVMKCTNGNDFLKTLEELSTDQFPDIALIDIQMKPMNGLELVDILKEKYQDLKIIILSTHYKKSVFGHLIKLGVSAFLPKSSSLEKLLLAIQSVKQTGVFLSKDDQQMLLSYIKEKPKFSINQQGQLSEREIDVVKLICLEFTNQMIADKLFLSKRTVESHRQRILEKIGAKNTVGIVIYAIAHNIHSLPQKFDSV